MLQRTNELAVLGRRDGDGQGGDQHGDVVVGADELARPRWAARNAAMMRYYDNEWVFRCGRTSRFFASFRY